MTEHKFTDEHIIKALDICGHFEACADCVLGDLGGIDKCIHTLMLNALDLINRQRAEIEKWQLAYDCADSALRELSVTRSEAIKEFAERLKEIKIKYALPLLGLQTKDEIERYVDDILLQMRDGIDRLIKEMTEGKQCF